MAEKPSNTGLVTDLADIGEAVADLVCSVPDQPLTLRSFAAMLLLVRGPMKVSEISRRLNVHKTTAWRMVDVLVDQGLAARSPIEHATDGRVRCIVQLLPNGHKRMNVFASRLQVADQRGAQ